MENANEEVWIVDTEWYNNLQLLKEFVLLVADMKEATPKDKKAAKEVIYLIEDINNPSTFKSWNVCLDIYDTELQCGNKKGGGIYWRSWAVYFEKGILSLDIEAKTNHTSDNIYHWGDDYYCYLNVGFSNGIHDGNGSFKEFVEDAKNYQSYITEGMKDIEVEISVG